MSDARNELLERWLATAGLREGPTEHHKASGNTLGEAFVAELCRSWGTHGQAALAHVASQKPDIYLKLVASFVAKGTEPTSDEFEDLKDGELAALIMAARAALKTHDRGGGPGDD
jgi:hypothetical protein